MGKAPMIFCARLICEYPGLAVVLESEPNRRNRRRHIDGNERRHISERPSVEHLLMTDMFRDGMSTFHERQSKTS
jgi:hypothetical protein